MQIDRERVRRMAGKWLQNISLKDVQESCVEEYLLSRRLNRQGIARRFHSSFLMRVIYTSEYESYKEQRYKFLKEDNSVGEQYAERAN
ncbi:MAG: hypothetical protein AABX17_04115 [Nanoarchaeota archaeon]